MQEITHDRKLDVLLKSAKKFYMETVGTEPPDNQAIKDWTIALLCAIVKHNFAVPTLSSIVLNEVWEENTIVDGD